ncbi:S-layer homology domain-containing protein [Cohnella caldifontis]|uniref:S-layer homology domain-containing protein n=1 Tax=Cohnella caldifontis TaxID=3027471 RepID=UPI0023EB8368|nr:S-layer homology domain-containing protein [Cohnella sp. YIM B05605]
MKFSKAILWMSIFLMLFGMSPPYVAEAAESGGQGQAQKVSFKDIQSHWAYEDIMELATRNIVSGFEDGTFRPNGEVTREQFLKILVDLRKLPTDSRDVPFRDVEQQRWSAPFIAAGVKQGILVVGEYPDGFKPSQPITRLEMAIWIVRALQLTPQTQEKMLGALKDQGDIESHRDLIEAALRTGIISGYPDGTFKGGNKSTRAEAVSMAVRALHYSSGQPSSPTSGDTRKIVEYLPEVKMSKSKNYTRKDDTTWVIHDPDLKLSVGDVFVMPPNDEFFGGIAKKVVSVRQEDGALVVTTSVPKVREVFSKLDVHTTEAIDPKWLTPADPSIQIVTDIPDSTAMLASAQAVALKLPCFMIKMDNANYDGLAMDARMNFCNLGVDADIGLDVDVDWFDVDLDFYSKLVLTGDVTTNVNVRAKKAITKPIYIPLTTPYYVPVFTGVFIKGQLFLKIEPDFKASLEVKFEDRFHLEQGFSFSSSQGFQTIDKTTNTATLDVNSNVNASLAAGPDVQLTLTLLDIAYAGLELYPGIKAGFYRYYEQGRCDEIRVDAFLKLDVIAGYDVWVAKGKLSKTLINLNYPLYEDQLHCPPPPAPGNLKAQLIREIIVPPKLAIAITDRINVQLNWSAAKEAASYRVKRAEAPGGPFKTIRSNLNDVTYTDTTTVRGKTYYYQVVAVNSYGESAPTQVLPVQIVDLPPPRPANLKAKRDGSGVTLQWDRLDGMVYVGNRTPLGLQMEHNGITYNVKRSDKERGGLRPIATNLTDPAFTDTTAKFDESYLYVVTAVDRYGESGLSNFAFVAKGSLSDLQINPDILTEIPWAVEMVIPPAPDHFIAEAHSGEVVLRWSPVEGATSYHVKRANAADGTYETIDSSASGTTFTDSAVENGRTYYYKVTAINNLGLESKDSPIQSAKPELLRLRDIITPNIPIPALVQIATPGNFQANTEPSSGKVTLSWSAVSGAAGYNVWRSDAANGTFVTIGAKVSGTAFTDTTAAIGQTHYYKVTAVDNQGNESLATPVKSAIPTRGIR